MRAKFLWVAALAAAVGYHSAPAEGAIIPVLEQVNPVSGGFQFTYEVDLQPDQRIDPTGRNPHFFTIYDFYGYVDGSAGSLSPDWVVSVQDVGVTPTQLLPFDDPLIPNITWTYVGDTVLGAGSDALDSLGQFWAVSTISDTDALGQFTGAATKDGVLGNDDGTYAQNIGFVTVPLTPPEPADVPEPSSLLLFAGTCGAFAVRRYRRVKSVS